MKVTAPRSRPGRGVTNEETERRFHQSLADLSIQVYLRRCHIHYVRPPDIEEKGLKKSIDFFHGLDIFKYTFTAIPFKADPLVTCYYSD